MIAMFDQRLRDRLITRRLIRRERATADLFDDAPKFGIRDEVEFVLREAERLRAIYPRITVVPLLYRVEDDLLYQLQADSLTV